MDMTPAVANLKLTILESEAQATDKLDSLVKLKNKGLPQELLNRLEDLWDARREVGGRVVHVGKIIFMEINRFLEENKNLAIGVALGAVVGALTSRGEHRCKDVLSPTASYRTEFSPSAEVSVALNVGCIDSRVAV
jgi:hypothetical protein